MENPQKSTQQPNTDPFALLNDNQWRYVTARIENPSFNKKDAALHVQLEPNTVYKWDDFVEEAVQIARQDIHTATLARRKQLALKALLVKASGLDSEDESIRQKTATEILEWELGKASQRTEVANADDKPFEVARKPVTAQDLTDDELATLISTLTND